MEFDFDLVIRSIGNRRTMVPYNDSGTHSLGFNAWPIKGPFFFVSDLEY